jgi:hypothetical protein
MTTEGWISLMYNVYFFKVLLFLDIRWLHPILCSFLFLFHSNYRALLHALVASCSNNVKFSKNSSSRSY